MKISSISAIGFWLTTAAACGGPTEPERRREAEPSSSPANQP